jgi:hypothetical protein
MSENIRPQPLSPEQREEIEKRTARTTPGPWEACTFDVMFGPHVKVQGKPCHHGHDLPLTGFDAEFIAAARADIPALLSHIAYLEEEARKASERNAALLARELVAIPGSYVAVPVEFAQRMERWAMKASFEYGHDATVLPPDNREKALEGARQASADAQTIAAALSQTPSGGK